MRQYRDLNNLPPMSNGQEELKAINKNKKKKYEDLESMSKDQLINEVIKARVEAERAKKRLCCQRRWSGKGIHQFIRFEYEIVYKLSSEFSINKLCQIMNVNRSGLYKWRNNMLNPSPKLLKRNADIALFKEYHNGLVNKK